MGRIMPQRRRLRKENRGLRRRWTGLTAGGIDFADVGHYEYSPG
jgi:hypothetical protein